MLRLGTLCGHPSDVMCEYPEVVSQKVICIPETRVRTNLGACILTILHGLSSFDGRTRDSESEENHDLRSPPSLRPGVQRCDRHTAFVDYALDCSALSEHQTHLRPTKRAKEELSKRQTFDFTKFQMISHPNQSSGYFHFRLQVDWEVLLDG